MKTMRLLVSVTMILLLSGTALSVPSIAASGDYKTLYFGTLESGVPKSLQGDYGNYIINLTVSGDGSGVTGTISSSASTESVGLLPVNQQYFYPKMQPNLIKLWLGNLNNGTIYVEISERIQSGNNNNPSQSPGTKLSCDIPGQLALGGDVVSFPILITNNNNEDKTYTLSYANNGNWNARFTSDGKGVYKVFVPKSQSKIVGFEIQTTGNSVVGEKKVTAKVDDLSIDLFVYITSINQSVDVSTKVTSKIASIGDKVYYDIRLRNLQNKENIYKLSVSGLPENWYYRYKEDASSVDEMAEVIVPASSEKTIWLEVVPPYSVDVGDYNFTSSITSPDGTVINKDLMLRLKSGTAMSVTSSKLAYDAKPGETFDIDVYVSNTGKGAALTNVYLDVKAPDGWLITTSPNRTNSIKSGESQIFRVGVTPPGNIVASDYEVSVTVKSDQIEKEKDYRVTIKTESYIPYIGGAIILFVVGGLVLVYRKYGRR
mgnify:CR=1 FL=1